MEGHMGDTVIRVENLSKKYVLSHQQEGRSYKALRDVIADGARAMLKPMQNAKLKMQDSSKEEFWALKDVSFEIKQGDRVGIIGRNGAGKSTLLKILSRIVEPTSGKIGIKGRVASLLEVGTGFHPELTGRENIFLNGAILGMSKAEIKAKFDEIVAFAEIEKFLDTPVKRYSSGMYVRLAFAVAAHLEPEILIVDEVLAVGDIAFQKKCLGKMEDVGKCGRTIIFVSHNMGVMTSLCTSGIYLKKGNIEFTGSINSAVNCYLSEFNQAKNLMPGVLFQHPYAESLPNEFTILKVSILDRSNELKPITKTWDYVKLRIHYFSPMTVARGSVVIEIYTLTGNKLFQYSTQPLSGLEFPFSQGESYIDCIVPQLPLAAGEYKLGIGLAVPMAEWLFWKEDLATLEVVESDIYNSNFPPIQQRTPVVIHHTWELPQNENFKAIYG